MKKTYAKGIGLVEVVIGISLISAALVGVVAGFHALVRVSLLQTETLKSVYLLEEGTEAVRGIRDENWSLFAALATTTPYYLFWTGNSWDVTTTQQVNDGMYRRVVFSDVFRDANDDIADSGVFDAYARKIDVSVERIERGATTTDDIAFYLTKLFDE